MKGSPAVVPSLSLLTLQNQNYQVNFQYEDERVISGGNMNVLQNVFCFLRTCVFETVSNIKMSDSFLDDHDFILADKMFVDEVKSSFSSLCSSHIIQLLLVSRRSSRREKQVMSCFQHFKLNQWTLNHGAVCERRWSLTLWGCRTRNLPAARHRSTRYSVSGTST